MKVVNVNLGAISSYIPDIQFECLADYLQLHRKYSEVIKDGLLPATGPNKHSLLVIRVT